MLRTIGLVAPVMFGMMWVLGACGARVNMTGSIPKGLYWTTGTVERGGYVMFCPPPMPVFEVARARGYIEGVGDCPGQYGLMMKRVAGMSGDVLDVDASGIRVNGELIPETRPRSQDGSGRQMPKYLVRGARIDRDALVLVSVGSALGFDARYFGPLRLTGSIEGLRPIWTF